MADYFVHRSQSTANSARHIIVAGHRGQAPVRSVIGEAATHPHPPLAILPCLRCIAIRLFS